MSGHPKELILAEGLNGQDDNIDLLCGLFEQLQLATVEAVNPQLDLLTFAQSAFYFAVITERSLQVPRSLPSDENRYPWNVARGERGYNYEPVIPSANQHPQIEPAHPMLTSQHLGAPSTGQSRPPLPTTSLLSSQAVDTVLGMVYLTASQNPYDPLVAGELNIGIIVLPQYQGKGYGRRTVEILLEKAFNEVKCHRVQAVLVDHWGKDNSLAFFTRMNFGHEGTLRRSFFSPLELEWKDATYLAILNTDWVMRGLSSPAPKSPWDELFTRHHREREALLRWDERRARSKRSNSLETVCDTAPTPVAESDVEMNGPDVKPTIPPSPQIEDDKGKKKLESLDDRLADYRNGYSASTSEASESDMEEVQFKRAKSSASLPWNFVDDSPRNSVPRSESPDGYRTSSSLDSWDVLETSSMHSSSSFSD